MQLTSPVFENGGVIPRKYGRDFENINPPLEIHEVPADTQSFVLFMEDPDLPPQAPVPVWDHWILFNLSSTLTSIPENWIVEGVRGKGTRGELMYGGPRPPDREHRYFFRLFALDGQLSLQEGATKEEILEAMEGHVLEKVELMGRFAP